MPWEGRRDTSVTLPPNQHLAAPGKWPVVGEKAPRASDAPWTVTITGFVRAPVTLLVAEIDAMPRVERAIDIHCVTRWSKPGVVFGGVLLADLLARCGPLPDARFISFVARSDRNHSTSLPLADALALGMLIALTADGVPLALEHGGPIRTVVPGRYFYKSLKWLERIDLLAEDRLGYWEAEAGYHNGADPWREERYIAPDAPRHVVEKALRTRDFSGLDLRGIDARGRDLTGLIARGAKLRDAHFEEAILIDADFSGANLSNAHLQGADLRGASFYSADVEGAHFDGADVTGTDFTGASLFGATFAGAKG
jgi:DMSO/TMAO reductase YedYZ molybdopterin-dependent catalytic subunit